MRYGHQTPSLEAFLGSMGSVTSVLSFPSPSPLRLYVGRICLSHALQAWTRLSSRALNLPFCVTPSSSGVWWQRNFNRLSIAYAFRPRLRSRLTLGGRAFPRKPWTFGGRDSHSSFATHAYILTRVPSTTGFRRRFDGHSTLLYRSRPLDLYGKPQWPGLMA